MPCELSTEADARFQRILRYNLIAFLVLGLLMPWLPLPQPEKDSVEELPPRMAKLLLEVKPVPPQPQPEPVILKPQPQARPTPPPEPVRQPEPARQQVRANKPAAVKKTISARQQAEQSGLLALKDTLSDLRQNSASSTLRNTQDLSSAGGQARTTERAILTSGTTRGSDGIKTASLSRNAGGTKLATRTTTRMHSPAATTAAVGNSGDKDRAGRSAGRSIEEIQMIFDRNKGAIYSIYNRALRQNPALQGKLVLQLTITPSGKVASCTVVSSELDDAVLNDKIAQRVKLFDFGVQDVNEVTITYPIDFLPA
jgi:outer membrane biosynthesis protein TonB